MMPVAVFASGEGTNLEALLRAKAQGRLHAQVTVVLSDRPGCPALARAQRWGVPAYAVDPQDFPSRDAFEEELLRLAAPYGAQLAVLAGYDRLAGPVLRGAFPAMINLHPALLPAFRGRDAIRRAWAYGVKVTGCTVHFVDEGVDTGPIIAQKVVPVRPGEDLAHLTQRIHRAEHRLLPQVVEWFAQGRVHLQGRLVTISDEGT
jgi:phosphoribosylglycinamide formyltransferase-1